MSRILCQIVLPEVCNLIKPNSLSSVAYVLESRGTIEDALEIATDLSIQLGEIEIAKVSAVKLCK